MSAEDCRARPGYYTDGLPKISDEIVGKAQSFYDGAAPFDSALVERRVGMRAALESVLPDLERECRKETERSREVCGDDHEYLNDYAARLETKLAERDKEIERQREEIKALKKDAKWVQASWQRCADAYNEKWALLAERDKEIERQREQIENLETQKRAWLAAAEWGSQELAERDKEIVRQREQIDSRQADLNEHAEIIADLRDRLQEEVTLSNGRIEELEAEIQRLRSSENKEIVRLTRERKCVDLCAESPKNYYTAGTLRADLNDFEERYGMDSRTHYELRRGNRLPKDIRRFDSAVWAGVYEEWVRLRKGTK